MKTLETIIDYLLTNEEYKNRITFVKKIPEKEAQYADFPAGLAEDLKAALEERGIRKLYTHQAQAYDLVRNGRNTVIVTPTASGKTLCYNLPVLNDLIQNPDLKAMYIFPTKALAQDQADEVNDLSKALKKKLHIFVYDGDTPASIRQSIRTKGQIVITNPDMLHSGILPNHPKWVKIFENLKYIIIDEVHMYRGVFGSHLANLILRLKRIARFYNSNVQFIMSSATIRNPGELSRKLISGDVTVVDQSGAPQGEKYFLLYNPPLVNAEQGIRRSVILEAEKLASFFIRSEISTLVFCRSRLNTELIYSYLIQDKDLEKIKDKIRSYRGGYLPSERREIEQNLRQGIIKGVVSTNALELGIDIGSLDVCILAGYPGSIASVWQQAGRSGRKNKVSAAFLIASNHPLDQFLIKNSEYFFSRPPEEAIINPENLFILMDHIKCAAFELPFRENERFGNSVVNDIMDYLEKQDIVHKAEETFYWNSDSYPAESVSLRSAMTENVVIINTTDNKNEVIGEVDRASAPFLLFEEAVYIHLAGQFKVEKLDLESGKAYVKEVSVNYYTDAIAKSDIAVLKIDKTVDAVPYRKHYCSVSIKTVVPKYKKIRFLNHENIGYGDIHLPQTEMQTYASALELREEFLKEKVENPERFSEVLMGMANLIRNISPLHIICDYSDIRTVEQRKSDFFNNPVIFVYDAYPGGVGLSEKLYQNMEFLLKEILKIVSTCECRYGCPSCIGPADEFSKETKGNVIRLLQAL
ncbi:MAG: DEAD/DEAH box helicase [bacterium]|nr:DEAD/DEAH box helicase [bacterium]